MKQNKFVAWGLIFSLVLLFSIPFFELGEDFYVLADFFIIVFDIWAIILLFKRFY